VPNPRFKPSQIFIAKCRAELESLLHSISDRYHEDIKNLYGDELYTDLYVHIAEDFKRSLHRCIIASRTHKLYNLLKVFRSTEQAIEPDIIVSDIQRAKEAAIINEQIFLQDGSPPIQNELPNPSERSNEGSEEHLIVQCHLPHGLISPELFVNFIRRVYLNQDVVDEESKLNQIIVDWLRINKPELMRISNNKWTSHKESFRTIRPDFTDFQDDKGAIMNPDQHHSTDNKNSSEEINEIHELYEGSSTSSPLTRTETFELISGDNPRSPTAESQPTSAREDSNVADEKVATPDSTERSKKATTPTTPDAPTTRTGLKPKTFTTPTEPRLSRDTIEIKSSTPKGSNSSLSKSSTMQDDLPKQPSSIPPTAAKRSSLSSQPDAANEVNASRSASNKIKATPMVASKIKPALLARAHPISLERSQSPATNVAKKPGRNFIAANKRQVAQVERKISAQADQTAYDSESEKSDSSAFTLEALTSDNLVAQMDKFSLISQSKLADALSQLYIDGILTDAIIYVKDDRRINAHRCILAARSAYLAELVTKPSQLSTASSPVAIGNGRAFEIDLSEYSYNAVNFSILHIYSGSVKVPEDLDLVELAKLTHQLHVTTLRLVCVHNLRMNLCHFFHKPCNVCSLGVLKTLPLAWRYDYSELYSKCLQWIGSHFASIFCLKEFSELKPHDLIEECYSATLNQLTPDNIIPRTIECQRLLKNLPRVKWTESIICLIGRLLEDFCNYVADNYERILQSESFTSLSKTCWECEILEENLLAAMNHLKPDTGCKTLIQLHKIECSMESDGEDSRFSDSFVNLVSKMRKYCERYLLKEATSVVNCNSWRLMSLSLQKRIKDQAIILADFDEPTKQLASKPKLQSLSRNNQRAYSSNADGARSPSSRSTPESRLKSPSKAYLPPPKNKTAAARHVKVLK